MAMSSHPSKVKAGDVVKLKSGGPPMTAERVDDRVERKTETVSKSPSDDRPDLARIDLGIPLPLVPAEFKIHSVIEILFFIARLDE